MFSPISTINLSNFNGMPQKEAIHEVSVQFVSILFSQIFDQMENGIQKSGLVPEQMGEGWYREWLMDMYAQNATKNDLNGLVKTVEMELTKANYSKR